MPTEWDKEEVLTSVGPGGDSRVMQVDIRLDGGQRVLNYDEVRRTLAKADRLAMGECDCRQRMKNCDRTLEGCLFMGDLADRGVKEGWAQAISHDDALAALGRAYDDGLVLIAADVDRDLWKICACCSCCCFMFAGYQRFGTPNSFVASPYVARHDAAACEACGVCVERCHFRALKSDGDAVRFDAYQCFGCGVCLPTCPTGAQTLVAR